MTVRNQLKGTLTPKGFEDKAKKKLSKFFKAQLMAKEVDGVKKKFDFVADDIVGDAKYYTLVRGEKIPPAKLSTIAEYVWLLEKTKVHNKFLVFGNDIKVPTIWLNKYGSFLSGVDFYFMYDDETLKKSYYDAKTNGYLWKLINDPQR